MFDTIAILLIYGSVISYQGCVWICDNQKIVNFNPSLEELSEALKVGGYFVGMGISPSRAPEIILNFNLSQGQYCLVIKSICNAKNPLKLSIYESLDGKSWIFIKSLSADTGNHTILLPFTPRYVMLKGEGGDSSLIDAVYIKPYKNEISYKICGWEIYIGGVWIPIPMLVILYMATFIGVSAFVEDSRHKISIALTVITILLNILLNVGIYPYPSIYSVVLCQFAIGCIAGLVLSKVFK